jgi:hypothetical protein
MSSKMHNPRPEESKNDDTLPSTGSKDSPQKNDFAVARTEVHQSPEKSEGFLNLPSEEEKSTLRHVSGSVPWIAFILCVVEFAERASYYGATLVFNNFLQFPLPEGI